MKLAEEAGEAEQAEYDRQVAAQMEWQRQEDAAVMAASEKKRDALLRERARLQQERAIATLTVRAHGHFKGGVASGGGDGSHDMYWQVRARVARHACVPTMLPQLVGHAYCC